MVVLDSHYKKKKPNMFFFFFLFFWVNRRKRFKCKNVKVSIYTLDTGPKMCILVSWSSNI